MEPIARIVGTKTCSFIGKISSIKKVIDFLLEKLVWFEFTPLPDDMYEARFKNEGTMMEDVNRLLDMKRSINT